MKVKASYSVAALPVQGAFPFATQPAFAYTIFPGSQIPQGQSDVTGFETNALADAFYPRPVFVPVNNYCPQITDYVAQNWFDPSFPTLYWNETSAKGFLKGYGDVFLTPWVSSLWTRDRARALFWAHQMSSPGSPNVRNTYDPANSGFTLTTNGWKTQGATLMNQAIVLRLGVTLDAVKEQWTGGPGNWTANYTYPGESDTRPYYQVRIKVQTQLATATHYYTLRWNQTGPVEVYTSTDGTLGTKVQNVNLPSGLNAVMGSPSYGFFGYYGWSEDGEGMGQTLDIRLIGGYIQINFGGHARPIEINNFFRDTSDPNNPNVGYPSIYITEVQFQCVGARRVFLAMAPMMFTANASMTTGQQSIGFVPQNTPSVVTRYAFSDYGKQRNPTQIGSVTTVTPTVNGTFVEAMVTQSNPIAGTYNGIQYSEICSPIKAITINFPEIVNSPYGTTQYLYPEEIDVTETFNPTTLEVERHARLVFNNFKEIAFHSDTGPMQFWGEFDAYAGAFAIQIQGELDYYDTFGNWIGSSGPQMLFTGFANLQSVTTWETGGRTKYVMECFDRQVQMQNVMFNLPWMDGYNMYYAAAFTANVCGIRRGTNASNTDLAFIQWVPDNPFDDKGDPSGIGAYFLPMGNGGSPLMKPPPGVNCWEWLQRLARAAGFMRYFDRLGQLHFEKYKLQSTSTPYRVFHLYDGVPEGMNGVYTSAVFGGEVRRDMLQVRNYVTILGIDPTTMQPTLTHLSDPGSVFQQTQYALGQTQANFLGFKRALVWSDSQFADPGYQQIVANNVFNVVRVPAIDTNFHTWFQPDLQLGFRIAVYDYKSGLYDRSNGEYMELMILSLRHRIRLNEAPQTSIGARWVPPNTGVDLPF